MPNDESNGAFVQPTVLDPPVIPDVLLDQDWRTGDRVEFPGDASYALYREPDGRSSALDASVEQLPVVVAENEIELTQPLVDRLNPAHRWYLPGYSVSPPDTAPLFRCEIADVPTASGNRIWSGRVTLSYTTASRIDDATWEEFAADRDQATLTPVTTAIDRVELRVPHIGEGGTLTTRSFQGSVDPDTRHVSFELKGTALRLAYESLANTATEQTKRPAIVFYTAFEGWDKLTPEEEAVVNAPLSHSTAAMAGTADLAGAVSGSTSGSPPAEGDSTEAGTVSVHAGLAEGLRHEFTTLSLGDRFATPPAVFGSVQTFNGGDPIGVRLRDRTTTSVAAMLEEEASKDDETRHTTETLGYAALPTGPIVDVSGTQIGEVGIETVSQPDPDHWHRFATETQYQQPVVFGQLQTYNGHEPCHIRLRADGATSSGVEYQIEEWMYLNQKHVSEEVALLVLEAGRHELPDGSVIDVGTVRTDHTWTQGSFDPLPSAPPVVLSQAQTTAGGEAVVTRQRNVANGKFDVRLQEEGASSGEHRTETIGYLAVDTTPPEYARQRFVVEEPVYVGFHCEEYDHEYVQTHDGQAVTFGCAAPWAASNTSGKRYKRLTADWLPDSMTVLESLEEPDTFVLIPDQFVVTRNQESHAPSMMLLQAPDPTGDESLVQFKFTVAPDLTPFERQLLDQRLYAETRRIDGVPQPPTVRLPSETLSLGGTFDWTDQQAASVNYAPVGDGYTVTVSYEKLSRAALTIETLTAKQGQLSGQLAYQVADDLTARSTLTLDLNRTTGPVLEATVDAGTVTLTNRCESPVTVTKLLGYTAGQDGFEIVELETARSLSPGDTTVVEDVLASAYTNVAAHYRITEAPERSLTERKIDVSRLTVTLSVTTNLNPTARAIDALTVEVDFPAADERDSCVLTPEANGFADVSEVMTFRLPLDQYLRPENRLLEYRVRVSYTDAQDDHVSDWQEYELGEGALLNITADAIGLEEL